MNFMKSNKKGSALIMAIALVTMLAIVGALFLLMSRIEEGSTSSLEEFKSLDAAVDSVIATIAAEVKLDTPGVDANHTDYYDYPWGDISEPKNADKWLANLEPYDNGGYKWRQISDIFGDFDFDKQQNIEAKIVSENEKIDVDPITKIPTNKNNLIADADADGDGVADSKWVKLNEISSSTGRPIYAAVRVIDNGGMLNVNTAYKFDPNSSDSEAINGRWMTQINLEGIRRADEANDIDDLQDFRVDVNAVQFTDFRYYTMYNFTSSNSKYTPFDISDELELRNRYFLTTDLRTRVDSIWPKTTGAYTASGIYPKYVPYDNTTGNKIADWGMKLLPDYNDAIAVKERTVRHLLTIYNVDRVIDPNGLGQEYIRDNTSLPTDANDLYGKLYNAGLFDENVKEEAVKFARICANMIDYQDNDSNVSIVKTKNYGDVYGLERPYISLSEVATKYVGDPCDANVPSGRSFAIELCRDFDKIDFDKFADNKWWLVVPGYGIDIPVTYQDFLTTGGRFMVVLFEDPNAAFDGNDIQFTDSPADGAENVSTEAVLAWDGFDDDEDPNPNYVYDLYLMETCPTCGDDCADALTDAIKDANAPLAPTYSGNSLSYDPPVLKPNTQYCWRVDVTDSSDPNTYFEGPVQTFGTNDGSDPNIIDHGQLEIKPTDVIELWREINGTPVKVDSIGFKEKHSKFGNVSADGWFFADSNSGTVKSYHRDIRSTARLKKIWNFNGEKQDVDTLGRWNQYNGLVDIAAGTARDIEPIQAMEYGFNNVGDIGNILIKDAYDASSSDRSVPADEHIFMDDREYQVRADLADPNIQKILNYITGLNVVDPRHRVKGRININTAPWYVLAQLPWVSERDKGYNDYSLAKSIVAYRDREGAYDSANIANNIAITKLTPKKIYRGGITYTSPAYDVIHQTNWRDYLDNVIAKRQGFATIGELCYVIAGNDKESMYYYARDGVNQTGFPDLTFGWHSRRDGMIDDFEERNLIFARISDLVTVRSDVFTAYVLVRLGEDGPQRRIITILDRSEVTPSSGKVKIIAKYPVPDPR